MDLFELMTSTRSIRKFISKPVEEEKVYKVIDAGHWAPTIGNLQEMQFVVVRDQGRKLQLAEAALGQYWIAQASVIIAVSTKDDKVIRIYGERGKAYIHHDAAAAVQNMILMASSLGLGSCWVGTFDEAAVERILKIPGQEITTHALVVLGYPAEKPNPPHRFGIETMTFFEEYGRKLQKGTPGGLRTHGVY
jgi:nitroreductase